MERHVWIVEEKEGKDSDWAPVLAFCFESRSEAREHCAVEREWERAGAIASRLKCRVRKYIPVLEKGDKP